MKSENKKRSIFDVEALMAQNNEHNILNNVEMISSSASNAGHALSKNIELETFAPKNDMLELIKTGYNLPEADEPEKMLVNNCEKRVSVELCDETLEDAPFRMVNLISGNYRLPEIETNDFMK